MSIKLGSNPDSLKAQRSLSESSHVLSKIYERLSSGQRINKASDDAAGLALADDLKNKNRIYTQGIRNGNDGISLLNIADSALDALSSIASRIQELSEQSATGTYSNTQRLALDQEAQALSDEFTRITQTTSFNGTRIFDGSLGSGIRLQLGIGIDSSVNASIGGSVGTGDFLNKTTLSTEGSRSQAVVTGDLNGDGILDLITAGYDDGGAGKATVQLGIGDGTFATATSIDTETNGSHAISLGDLNGDGILDLVTAGQVTGNDGSLSIRLGLGDGTFGSQSSYSTQSRISYAVSLGDINGDNILDLVTAGYTDAYEGYASVRIGAGDGTFGAAADYTTEVSGSYAVSLKDLNNDGNLDLISAGHASNDGYATIRLGSGDGTFGSSSSIATESFRSYALAIGDLNGDGIEDLITAGADDSSDGYASIRLGQGDGSFAAATSFATEAGESSAVTLADINGDGILDLLTAGTDDSSNGFATSRLGVGDGSFGSAISLSMEEDTSLTIAAADINGDGVADLISAGNDNAFDGTVSIRLARTEEGLGALSSFSLKTQSDSLQALGMIDKTIENLSKQRGQIGASQSRVSFAISNLESSRENFKAAESRIRDSDVASDAAALVRTQILQQAATSVLAQANQIPSLSLLLLR